MTHQTITPTIKDAKSHSEHVHKIEMDKYCEIGTWKETERAMEWKKAPEKRDHAQMKIQH